MTYSLVWLQEKNDQSLQRLEDIKEGIMDPFAWRPASKWEGAAIFVSNYINQPVISELMVVMLGICARLMSASISSAFCIVVHLCASSISGINFDTHSICVCLTHTSSVLIAG